MHRDIESIQPAVTAKSYCKPRTIIYYVRSTGVNVSYDVGTKKDTLIQATQEMREHYDGYTASITAVGAFLGSETHMMVHINRKKVFDTLVFMESQDTLRYELDLRGVK